MIHDRPLRIGLCGSGHFALFHAQQLFTRDDFQITDCVASSPSAVPLPWGETPPRTHDRLATLLQASEVDGVLLCDEFLQPTQVEQNVTSVLEAGRNVILGEPVDLTWEQWHRCETLLLKQHAMWGMYLPGEFDSDFQTAAEIVASGRLGEVVSLHYQRFRFTLPALPTAQTDAAIIEPRLTLGILRTDGVEAVDQMLRIQPRPVQRVWGRTAHSAQLQILLDFGSPCFGEWELDGRFLGNRNPGWQIQGTQAGYQRGKSFRLTDEGEVVETLEATQPTNPRTAYDGWSSALRRGANSPPDLAHARRLFQTLAALREAIQTGAWVSVSE